jgi:hypothetical protein
VVLTPSMGQLEGQYTGSSDHPGPPMVWIEPPEYPRNFWILGRECSIWLAPRPLWCDRGNWLATIDAWGKLGLSLDWADGWPRYYFDLDRAKAEIEAWLAKRRQDPRVTP